MDFPTVRGIAIEAAFKSDNVEAQRRFDCVTNLTNWAAMCGFLSRDTVKFVVGDDGFVRCRATRFIPAGKHIMHVPFRMDLSFTALKHEIVQEPGSWHGWTDLKSRVKNFECAFHWHPYNSDQKDNFSKNLLMVMTIIGVLKKLNSSPDLEKESEILKTFSHYWHSLPSSVGSVLLDWTEAELEMLKDTSFFNCLPDAKRFGVEMFQLVVVPFIAQYPDKFGETIDFETFMRINCVVCSRSFSITSNKAKFFDCKLIPIVDLVNGKTNEQHNCSLENCAIQKDVNGEFVRIHALDSVCDINAGDEIFLEYAQVGNGRYLLSYDIIPLDPDIIMNNQKTDVFLDFGEFLDTELLRMHPNVPAARRMKKSHIYGFFNLPKVIPVSMDDLFCSEYTCVPALRQVLIFLQCNEQDALKAVASSKIKSQFDAGHLFVLFKRFIEVSMGKPDFAKFRSLLTPCGPGITGSETPTAAAGGSGGVAIPSAIAAAAAAVNSLTHTSGGGKAMAAAAAAGATPGGQVSSVCKPVQSAAKSAKAANSPAPVPAPAATAAADAAATKTAAGAGAGAVAAPTGGTAGAAAPVITFKANKALTTNMRSAIFLYMSERLVIEVMINRFINLFPENCHELGYDILCNHLVSRDINAILEQLWRPILAARASSCMVCGAGGSMSKCSRCKSAFYCSAACQKEHWTYHKKVCGKS
jgi:hypothetical protein